MGSTACMISATLRRYCHVGKFARLVFANGQKSLYADIAPQKLFGFFEKSVHLSVSQKGCAANGPARRQALQGAAGTDTVPRLPIHAPPPLHMSGTRPRAAGSRAPARLGQDGIRTRVPGHCRPWRLGGSIALPPPRNRPARTAITTRAGPG